MQQPKKKQELSGWGNVPRVKSNTYRPEKIADLHTINSDEKLICRGMGRSYGDASLNSEYVVLSKRLDRFLGFDEKKGVITVQPGVTLADILDVIVPKGWFLSVIPGTKQVSVGGAIASNIHGKNHYKEGDFINHVLRFKLLIASGEVIECSKTKNADLFWATAGGMGLTGIIEEASIKLRKISSLSLKTHTKKVGNIHEMVQSFEEAKAKYEHMVGWIDHFAKDQNANVGRGVFEKASHITVDEGGKPVAYYKPPKSVITVPRFFPSFVLNKYSMALYNIIRFSRFSDKWKESIVDFNSFFHPLDNLKNWKHLYGKNGFFQYQFVIPKSNNVASQLQDILSFIHKRDAFSFLAVIKYHGQHSGLLSFPVEGYSIALDFPNTPKVRTLQRELNEKVCGLGGRVYLAKDALLTADIFEKMYQETLPKWRKIIKQSDPSGRFESLMSMRLNLKGEI